MNVPSPATFMTIFSRDDANSLAAKLSTSPPDEDLLQTLVGCAANKNRVSCLRYLLKKYPKFLNAEAFNGQTALSCAVAGHAVDATLFLIEAGAEIDAKDTQGHTALWHAVTATTNVHTGPGNEKIQRVLIAAGADISDAVGSACLQYAICRGQDDLVHVLLEKNVPLDSTEYPIHGIVEQMSGSTLMSPQTKNILQMLSCARQEAEIMRGMEVPEAVRCDAAKEVSRPRRRPGVV